LLLSAEESPHPDIPMPVQFLSVGKAALNGFLAPLIQSPAFLGQSMTIDLLPRALPDMPGHGFDRLGVTGALTSPWAIPAKVWV